MNLSPVGHSDLDLSFPFSNVGIQNGVVGNILEHENISTAYTKPPVYRLQCYLLVSGAVPRRVD